jgi:hypothetical protein
MIKYLPSQVKQPLGCLCGLAVATGSDYVLIPWLADKTGQMAIAIIVGLAFGAMIMFVFGEAPERVVNTMRKHQRIGGGRRGIGGGALVRRLSLPTLAYTFLVTLTILAMLLGQLLPAASLK